jgi:hypothetical protein
MFKPGQSGNPSGKPKALQDVIALARSHTPVAIGRLARIVHDDEAPPAVQVTAAIALLDRGWGRPTQTIEATTNSNSLHLHLVAAQSVLAQGQPVIEAATNTVTEVITDALPTE